MDPAADEVTIEAAEVVSALTAVLTSVGFARAPRSREFLAHVVTEALAGRGDRLNERTIGRSVLRRADSFDGRAASIVRVRATRVRAALADYYAAAGQSDPVRIVLPTGTYCPVFQRRPADDRGPADLQPGVVVMRFAPGGLDLADAIAVALAEAIAYRLEQFPGVRVFGPTTQPAAVDPRDVGVRLGQRFVLHGTVVVRDERVRVSAALTDAASGTVAWRGADTRNLSELTGFEFEDEWAASVAGQLGDWAGLISRTERSNPVSRPRSSSYRAYLAFCGCQEDPTPVAIAAAAAALDAALEEGDRSPSMLAMRGWICASEFAHGPTPGDAADVARAEALAREALGVDPHLALAHVVLCNVAILRRQWDVTAWYARRTAELAPDHPSTLSAAATGLTLSGDWPGGLALAREASRLNPHLPAAHHILLAMGCLLDGDDVGALAEASLVHTPGQLWGPLYRALALAGLGHLSPAWEEMDAVLAVDPTFLDDPEMYFRNGMRASDEQFENLLRHLEPFLSGRP